MHGASPQSTSDCPLCRQCICILFPRGRPDNRFPSPLPASISCGLIGTKGVQTFTWRHRSISKLFLAVLATALLSQPETEYEVIQMTDGGSVVRRLTLSIRRL